MTHRSVRWLAVLGFLSLAVGSGSYLRFGRTAARPSSRPISSESIPGEVEPELANAIASEPSTRKGISPAAVGGWKEHLASFAREGEIVSKRDAYARHFANPDGTVDALISASPIHYQDEGGSWQEVDTEVVPTKEGYANTKNNLKSRFPKWSTGRTTVGVSAERSYHWTPRYVGYDGTHVLWRASEVEGSGEGEEVSYPGVFPGATDRYRVHSSGVKHDLVLETRPTGIPAGAKTVEYVGEIELGEELGFWVNDKKQEGEFRTEGVIWVCAKEGEKLFCLDRALAVEEGHPRSVGGSYVVRPLSHRTYEMRLEIPAQWLLDPKRRYPVCIDPTTWSRSAVRVGCAWAINSENGDTSWDAFGEPGHHYDTSGYYGGSHWFDGAVGREYDWNNEFYRSGVEWSTSSVPLWASILDAKIRLYVAPYNYSDFDSDRIRVQVHVLGYLMDLRPDPEDPGAYEFSTFFYNDCGDGTVCASNLPLHTGQGSASWRTLPEQARHEVEAFLGDSVLGDPSAFGIGVTSEQEGDRGVILRLDRSLLKLKYNSMPSDVVLLTPSNGARRTGNSVKFSWSASSDADADLLTYALYCDASSSPATLLYSGPATSFTWNGSVDGKTYFWRIRVSDGTASRTSTVRSFRENAPPPAPMPVLPSDGSTIPAGLTTLFWTSGGADPDADPILYQWRVDTTDPFQWPLASSGGGASTAAQFSAAPNTTYFWSVRAFDGHEYSTWSAVGSFTTGS